MFDSIVSQIKLSNILSSLVAMMIFAVVGYTLKLLSKYINLYVNHFLSWISKNYKKSIYLEAARNDRMRIPIFSLGILVGFVFLLVLGFSIGITLVSNNLVSDTQGQLDAIDGIYSSKKKTSEELSKEVFVYKEKLEELNNEAKMLHSYSFVIIAFVFFWFIYFYVKYIKLNVACNLISDFEHSIQLLSPSMRSDDILEIRAQWARMESEDDYKKILKKLEGVAES